MIKRLSYIYNFLSIQLILMLFLVPTVIAIFSSIYFKAIVTQESVKTIGVYRDVLEDASEPHSKERFWEFAQKSLGDLGIAILVNPAEAPANEEKLEADGVSVIRLSTIHEQVDLYIYWANTFTTSIFGSFLLFSFGSILFFTLIAVYGVYHFKKSKIPALLDELYQLEQLGAISKTTQMIAHDVRKPFSLVKMLIDSLEREFKGRQAYGIIHEAAKEINYSLREVDHLISDIMEIGSKRKNITEPISIDAVIESAIVGGIRHHRDVDEIKIYYQFQHSHKVLVDSGKVVRIFDNLIGNALQASKGKGEIWFETKQIVENDQDFLRVCVGNTGPVIPADSIPKLFNQFFSSGKKGGTGLGLAIVHKTVVAHGGRVWCESTSEIGGAEFYFTLPIAIGELGKPISNLPTSSEEILSIDEKISSSKSMIKKIEISSGATLRKVKILAVDDEAFYLNQMKSLLSSIEIFGYEISTVTSTDPNAIVSLIEAHEPDLIVSDFDFRNEQIDGYDVLRNARKVGKDGTIYCLHSNRNLVDTEGPYDVFLQKPMSQQALESVLATYFSKELPTVKSGERQTEVVIVDDSPFVLESWKTRLEGTICHIFISPSSFYQAVDENKISISQVKLMIVDYYFDNEPETNGVQFSEEIKMKYGNDCPPVFLCTDSIDPELQDKVERVIGKNPIGIEELDKLIAV